MSVLLNEPAEAITEHRQLVDYFAKAAKPKANWLIGCENEKFPYRLQTLKPVSYDEPDGLHDFLEAMQKFGWKPVMEGDNIIGLARGRSGISFEPGGQVELAGEPLHTLHEAAVETEHHLHEVNEIGERLGIGFLGMGFHPTARRKDIRFVPKARYRIMRNYMPKRGRLGIDMMLRTCTTQVNLDYADEADMVKKFRVALALQPIATALFAASPFTESKPNNYQSYRMHCWSDTDSDRSGNIPFVFEKGFGYERYTDYALDVPMYFVWRKGRYVDCTGQSFRDFLQGKLPALQGVYPTMTDWANHLTTLFPDVRLKKVLEMRGADTGSRTMIDALPAFWTGLLYDGVALDSAWNLVKDWTPETRRRLHDDAPRLGLHAALGAGKAVDLAKNVLLLAREGLRRRAHQMKGKDETHFLDVLFDFAESGQSYSDRLLAQFGGIRDFYAADLFQMCRLLPR